VIVLAPTREDDPRMTSGNPPVIATGLAKGGDASPGHAKAGPDHTSVRRE
jgi:hypothetical protein